MSRGFDRDAAQKFETAKRNVVPVSGSAEQRVLALVLKLSFEVRGRHKSLSLKNFR